MKYNLMLELMELNNKGKYNIKKGTINILYQLLHHIITRPGMLSYKFEEKSNRLYIDTVDNNISGHILIESGQIRSFKVELNSENVVYGINPDSTTYLRRIINNGSEYDGIYEFSTKVNPNNKSEDELFFVRGSLKYYDEETLRFFEENSIPYENEVAEGLAQCGIEPDVVVEESPELNKGNNILLENSCAYLEKHIGLFRQYPQIIQEQKGKTM